MELLKKKFEPRRYQESIFAQAVRHNTLVVLPTGLGKTMIAIMLAVHRLTQYPQSKVLVLAPTKPLVQQHERSFRDFLDLPDDEVVVFTGNVSPAKRAAQWESARLIFSTPQGLENDVLGGKVSLADVSLLVFDEAHRATGDYSYVFLADQYRKQAQHERVLALTASPGTDKESITEVCERLGIEEIEVRSQEDADVAPYVQEMDIQWVEVELPKEMGIVRSTLQRCFDSRIARLRDLGVTFTYVNKRTLLQLQGQLQGELAKGERDFDKMKALSVAAEALKISHALELVDTQGVYALRQYFDTIKEQAAKGLSKAVKNIIEDVDWKTAQVQTMGLIDKNIEHPKMRALRKVVLQHTYAKEVKIIIFTQYRDQAVKISRSLDEINVSSKVFVGQAKKGATGMSQKEQKAMLDEFREGKYSCLIATSVAEEGLDIPKVDLVIFYEPVPSAIRTVQRRGRTGRGEKGKVIILMTKGTSDVSSKWAAHHKEKRMYRAITDVKKEFRLKPESKEQKNLLQQYFSEKKEKGEAQAMQCRVVADYREKATQLMKMLIDAGVQIDLQQLAVGDYQLSDRVVIEYKRVPDFVDSIVDGRLLSQVKSLKQYPRPLFIIEGEEDLYSQRKIHHNAINGMLATITVSYGIPVLRTKNYRETAGILLAIAKREQAGGQDFQYHSSKPVTDDEVREYIVAAFPGIGSQLAKPLLLEFGSIKNIVNASEEELKKVPLIGEKKAKRIKDVAEGKHGGKEMPED